MLVCNDKGLECLPEITEEDLTEIHCHNNQLISLPESICNLSRLRILQCTNNQIRDLPESICNLSNLQRLYLGYNHLVNIPDSICHLSGLQELFIHHNYLRILPDSLGKLMGLQVVNCSNNQLIKLPESIIALKKCRRYFHYNENPITYVYPDFLDFERAIVNRLKRQINYQTILDTDVISVIFGFLY